MREVATHRVAVAGRDGGTYDLTWGQVTEFQMMDAVGPEAAAAGSVRRHGDLRGMPSVAAVITGIREVLCRYDALRTTFEVDGDGTRRQVVRASGELVVGVYTAAADELDATVNALAASLAAAPFQPDELPIRLAVVTEGELPHRLVMAMYHPVADGVAAAIVHEEIRRLATDPAAPPSQCWQPGQIAEYEGGERGRRHAERVESYVRTQLTRSPPVSRFDGKGGDGTVELYWAALHSPATAAATLLLSRRYQVSPATVLLAGYGVVVGRWLGRDLLPLSLACANREDARLERSIANLAQFAPVTLRVGDGTFAQICAQTVGAAMRAYRYGRHDPRLRRRTLAELEQELGEPAWPPYSVNLRLDGQVAFNKEEARAGRALFESYAGIDGGQLRALAGRGRADGGITPQTVAMPNVRFNIWDLTDEANMMLMGDNTAVPPEGPRLLLGALESFLVEAACDDGADAAEMARRAGLPTLSDVERSADGLPR